MSNFHSLEVVGRGSETQLQVGENFIKLIQQDKGQYDCVAYLYVKARGEGGGVLPTTRAELRVVRWGV